MAVGRIASSLEGVEPIVSTIGIIGTGWVGAGVAISTLHMGLAQELLLHDARAELAQGEAMDLAHGASFYPPCRVRAVTLPEMQHADAIVVSAGRGGTARQTRLELLRENAAIIRDLAGAFGEYRGIVVIVTNPVDVLTYLFREASGLSAARVIGTGTMLDTARLRQVLGRELDLDPRSIHAQVIGEHGDSEVVLWSTARVGGGPLRSWPGWTSEREQRIAGEVRRAAYEIIRRKGATNHAIGLVTASLLASMLRNERRVLTISRVQDNVHGVPRLALSLPAIVAAGGAVEVLQPPLDGAETAALAHSGEVLQEAVASISERKTT
jgi:L-lactate dehydrogenase